MNGGRSFSIFVMWLAAGLFLFGTGIARGGGVTVGSTSRSTTP